MTSGSIRIRSSGTAANHRQAEEPKHVAGPGTRGDRNDQFGPDPNEVITRLRDLQEAGMPVHVAGGNHDHAVVGKRCPSLHCGLRGAGNAA